MEHFPSWLFQLQLNWLFLTFYFSPFFFFPHFLIFNVLNILDGEKEGVVLEGGVVPTTNCYHSKYKDLPCLTKSVFKDCVLNECSQ